MKAVSNCLYLDIPIWVFHIEEVPELPQGFYYVIGVDFDEMAESDSVFKDVQLNGPFGEQRAAQESAISFIDDHRADLDQAESRFYFADEE